MTSLSRNGGAAFVAMKAMLGVLRLTATLLLAWVVWSVVATLFRADFQDVFTTRVALILVAFGLYMMGQVMRVVRLALLIGNARLSLRKVAAFHFYTVGVALGAPFRLGDVYRCIELGRFTGGIVYGITFVWIERLFDLGMLLPLLLMTLKFGQAGGMLGPYAGITLFTLLFVSMSILLVAILPENLRRFGTYIIRQHEGAWTVTVLRGIEDIRKTVRRIPSMLKGKLLSLTALTVLVWVLEVGSFALVMLSLGGGSGAFSGLLAFLSRTTTGGTLPEILATAEHLTQAARTYLVAGQMPLALIAAVACFYYFWDHGWKSSK